MYRLKPGIKTDPKRRWALPDRIFFGYGACHILAGVYLARPPLDGFYAERIVPKDGFAGNHIFVTDGAVAFDYHGYSARRALLEHHMAGWAAQYDRKWACRIEHVTFDLLSRSDLNARKMLGPDQYFSDPVARANAFINRIDHLVAYEKATLTL
ncbi:hypothetical protein [Thalassococcus sp. S3]|uniref:hypothetical protein n=1 Tax=Thalassococcus sp. S3 TaxID=2017482 RepID=UPI0010244ACE|nr:hypothetical protein [Thalassococcus sp. S3]QBF31014.1 hypothetical protein CFI11_07245 [Thalassococcus sp. S3]